MRQSPITTLGDAPSSGGLTYACVNPLDYGEEIKDLFVAHERPEFPAFFNRTYADAVAHGATSWVGRDAEGRICAHVAQFPRPFRFGKASVRGSLIANLMVAKAHRTLWPALKLLRRVVQDSRESGNLDFLYGDPNPAALAVGRAVGFRTVGALQRFVLPLADRRRVADLGLRLYHRFGRFRVKTASLAMTARCASEAPAGPEVGQADEMGALRPVPQPSVYRHRLAGYPSRADSWYTFRRRKSSRGPVGAALVRGPDAGGLAVVCALRYESLPLLSALLIRLAGGLRDAGHRRLEVSVMRGSRLAAEVRRAGFIRRQETIPVLAMPLTPLGTEAVAVGAEWRLLPTDLDR